MKVSVRVLKREDADSLSHSFFKQGEIKPPAQFLTYFTEQNKGDKRVLIAEFDSEILGYISILPSPKEGPFKGKKYPQLIDLNVFKPYENNGVATRLFEEAEQFAFSKSDKITLCVPLHKESGLAQKLCVKRGYIPDGSGVWYKNINIKENEFCANDNDLLLYMYKELKTTRHSF